MKRWAMVVIGWWLLAGTAQAFSVSYDQTMTQGGKVMTAKVVVKDELFRMEMAVGAQPTITVKNASGVYSYLPKEGMAMKLPAVGMSQQPAADANRDYKAYLRERQAELVGQETVNGYPCEVYRFRDPHTQGMTTVWVWKEHEFPVKFELSGLGGGTVVELTNVHLGVAVNDALFELPTGVQVMDAGSMFNTLP